MSLKKELEKQLIANEAEAERLKSQVLENLITAFDIYDKTIKEKSSKLGDIAKLGFDVEANVLKARLCSKVADIVDDILAVVETIKEGDDKNGNC